MYIFLFIKLSKHVDQNEYVDRHFS